MVKMALLENNKMKRLGIWLLLSIAFLSASSSGDDEDFFEARSLYLKGQYAEAVRYFKAALKQDPKSEIALVGLIRSLLRTDSVQEAYKSAEAAVAAFPNNALLHAAQGDVLFRKAQISNAQKAYIKAINLDRQIARGYWGLSKIHAFDFNRKTAGEMIRKAYELDPADPDIVCDYISYLPEAEQTRILEKYLSQTDDPNNDRKARITGHLQYLKNSGGLKSGEFKIPEEAITIPLSKFMPQPDKPYSGYHVKVNINGKSADLQLDSGGNGILIQRRFAEKLGLNIITASQVKGIGESGARSSFLAQAQNLQIGSLSFPNATMEVVDQDFTANSDGIIGSNFFNRFLITLNFPKEKMELRPLPKINGMPHSDPETWKDLNRTTCPEIASFQSMGMIGNLFVPVQVNNKKIGYFMVDTGSASSMLSREFAVDFLGLIQSYDEIQGISGSIKTYQTTSEVILKMGQFRQRQTDMYAISFKDISRDYGFEVSGIIGNSLLHHLAITIDYRDGYINFVYEK
jgi:tetratricopeptide (TPR) repeat protein